MSTTQRKAAFLSAFKEFKGVQLDACRATDIPRMTVNRWRKKDKNFNQEYERITTGVLQMLHGVEKTKDILIASLVTHNGSIIKACRAIGISYESHRNWYKDDLNYRDKVDNIITQVNEGIVELAIEKLEKMILEEDFRAIKLAIDKLGSSRGMVERSQHEITAPGWMNTENKELDEI